MIDFLRSIEFQDPWFLLGLLFIPIMVYLRYFRRPEEQKPSLRIGNVESLVHRRSWRTQVLYFLPVLRWLALTLLILALARPQLSLKEEAVTAEGIDIILALDLSSSMLAKDFSPDRLEVSKKVAAEFVAKRGTDRIGVVVFSGESFTQCPLTSDHRIVQRFLSQLQCGFLEEGTAIGMGLATAVNRLKRSDAESKVVILLTDGDNNTGYIKPLTAAEMARELDLTVYTIGVGSKGMALTPQGKRSDGSYVFDYARVMINEPLLQEIAETTGGQYFRATSAEALQNVYDEIDKLEKTEREVTTFRRYSDEFSTFLRIGLGIFLIHLILQLTFFRTYP
ncbi:MAG: VWA domain-containing protein [Saprospiraceae bacterium]|nr:VWA domain-containing protein [Saprospiraceae bacterium]